MKFGSFRIAGRDAFGAVTEGGIADPGERLGACCRTLRELLALESGSELARRIAGQAR